MHTRKVETCLESIYIGHKPLEYLGLFPCTGPWDEMGAGHYALEYLPFISMGLAQEAILDGLWPCLEIAKPRNSRKCIVPLQNLLFTSLLLFLQSCFCGMHPSISTTSGHPSYLFVSLLFLICCTKRREKKLKESHSTEYIKTHSCRKAQTVSLVHKTLCTIWVSIIARALHALSMGNVGNRIIPKQQK